MGDGVGVDHPAGAGWKVEGMLWAVGLEAGVFLEEVVEAHHEVVVGAALDSGNGGAESDAAAEGLRGAAESGVDLRRDFSGRELLDDGGEGVADDPVARARGVDVVEEAENARAVGGARGESVSVQQV